ncbi:MAG: NAD-dependent epimerase/dehydratase [uncultured bacterium]|nr:MAG: NAD-dependent epimerase/dehydratase [uncultured bacterium]
MANKKVLITGASGFIPSYLTKRLLQLGYHVSITTRYKSIINKERLCEVWDDLHVIEADIRNQDSLRQIALLKPDIIIHMAAYNHVGDSFKNVSEALDVNCKGTANILEAYQDYERLIYTSTSEIYGYQEEVPFREEMLPRPISPYAIGKYSGELYCQMKMRMMNKPIVILRPFNTFGPYQSSKAVIGEIIEKLLKNQPIEATEGKQTREFNYVDDIVDGFVKAVEVPEAVGKIINLGNGREVPIRELITTLHSLTNSRSDLRFGVLPLRPTEIWRMCADNSKAREILRWFPAVSFEEGLKRTIEWFKDYFKV